MVQDSTSATRLSEIAVQQRHSLARRPGGRRQLAGHRRPDSPQVPAQIDALLARRRAADLLEDPDVPDLPGRPRSFPGMNAVWEKSVPAGVPPARHRARPRSAKPEWRVEMVVTAAV
jgi:hypothetical protein